MGLTIEPPCNRGIRVSDKYGSGSFRAPRGDRLHKGIDFLASPGDRVTSPVTGYVLRIGYCYPDDPQYRLIEIGYGDALVRVLYVLPTVSVASHVEAGEVIGMAQDVASRYGPGMDNHVHLDVCLMTCLTGRGRLPVTSVWADPALFIKWMRDESE